MSFVLYLGYSSYSFQVFLRKFLVKKSFVFDFLDKVKGIFISSGYYALSYKILSSKEYSKLKKRYKIEYGGCYNVVKFKTTDANWELFFYLVREGIKFKDILVIRAFPTGVILKSEGNVEKLHSRLNLYSNNRYLTHILEENSTQQTLNWLLRSNSDVLQIFNNNLHYKITLENRLSSERVLEMIKALNIIKGKIYKKGLLEY